MTRKLRFEPEGHEQHGQLFRIFIEADDQSPGWVGRRGGLVRHPTNIQENSRSWIGEDAIVLGGYVSGNAQVYGRSVLHGYGSSVEDNASIDDCTLYSASVSGFAVAFESELTRSAASGNARIDKSMLSDASVFGSADVSMSNLAGLPHSRRLRIDSGHFRLMSVDIKDPLPYLQITPTPWGPITAARHRTVPGAFRATCGCQDWSPARMDFGEVADRADESYEFVGINPGHVKLVQSAIDAAIEVWRSEK